MRRSPESGELYDVLGRAYARLGRHGDAQRAFEASLVSGPDIPYRLYGLGESLRSQGKFDDAIVCYERTLEIVPDWELGHRGLSAAFFQTRQFARAEEHCRSCVKLNPTSSRYRSNLGMALARLGRLGEAASQFKEALRYDRKSKNAYIGLSRTLETMGRRADAIASLTTARSVLPNDLSIKCFLAWLLATTAEVASEDSGNAVLWAKECCEAFPEEPKHFDALGAAHAANGDFAEAEEAARRALSLAEARGQIRFQGEIEGRIRRYQAGERYVDESGIE